MKKVLLVLLVLCIGVLNNTYAQSRKISGTITGADDGLPLPGVSVKVANTSVGTQTGADGSYSITLPSGSGALQITYLGYASQTVSIGAANVYNVRLTPDTKSLNEVVVTGYGVQRKIEVAGSVASIKGSDFQNQPITNVAQAMQGRAAGVAVQSNNGIPGGAISVQIRGIGSVNAGTAPLYIVDGVQLNTSNVASFTQSNPLASINTNDIESINILKDAATASQYGAQAANGVVIITTKKGKAGKTLFNANYYTGRSSIIKKFDVLDAQQYFQMRTEALTNANPTATATAVRNSLLSEMGFPSTTTNEQVAALPTYDWQDAAYRKGVVNNYELSARGGNDKTTFFMSGAYNAQGAVMTKADFKRGTFRLNLNHQATDKLSFETNLNLSSFTQKIPFATDGSTLGNPAFSSSLIIPSSRIYNDNGTYFGLPGAGQVIGTVLNQNIIAVNDYNSGFQRTNGLIGGFAANYKIVPGLNFRSFYSLDYRLVQGKSYRDPRTNDASARRGLGQVQSDWNTNFMTTQSLTYTKVFNSKHKVDAAAIFEYRSDNQNGISAAADGFPSFEFTNLNSAANPVSVGEFTTGYKRVGILAKASYNYAEKYILSLIVRRDGSSRFGANNKFGFFGGVSGAWNVKEESFLKDVEWLDGLKLRASYGRTGNDQIGNFDALALYSGGGVYGGLSGIAPSGLANPDLGWETNETIEGGIDFSIFKSRIFGGVTMFRKTTLDLLLSQPLQTTTGYSSVSSNVGSMYNQGLEVELNSVNFKTKDFTWSSSFNFTSIINRITSIYGGLTTLPSDPSFRVGWDIGAIYAYQYAGVNPATGRPMWYDVNNNITYNPQASTDRKRIGSTLLRYYGGFTNTFNIFGVDVMALLQYQYGRKQLDSQLGFLMENGNRALNTLTYYYENRWTTPGQITSIPRPYSSGVEAQGSNHVLGSTRNYLNTDYIRLKEVQVGYNLPKKWLDKVKLQSARIYVQASNLGTYTDFRGYDPEFYSTALGIIPQTKNYTFGVQLGL